MSRLARNILFNVAGQGLVLVLGFVAVRFIYRQLGADAVGIVFFALTLNAVITSTMDLGISSTIVREVAARYRSSPHYVHRLLSTAGFFYWVCYAALALVLVSMAGPITRRWLNVGTLDVASAELSLRILGAGTLLALPRSLYASLFRGLQRMGVTNSIDAASMAIQQAGIVAAIAAGGDIVAVSSWIAVSTAAGVGVYMIAASRVVPVDALLPGLDRGVVRQNQGFASRMTAVSLLAMVHTQADKLAASGLLPLGVFGLYGFGSNAVNRGMLVTAAVAQAAFPSFSELEGSGDHQALVNQFLRLQDVVTYVSAAVFAIAPFATVPVFAVLFGPAEAELMLAPCTLLALGFYMNSTMSLLYMLSLAVGRPGIALSLNAWAVVIVLPLTVLLVWRWGVNGAALSWVLYHAFAYVYFVPRVCRECARGEPWSWYRHVARFLIPAAAIYAAAWVGAASLGLSAGSLAAGYAGATAVYAVFGWKALSPDVRLRVRSVLLGRTAESGHGE
jgi:O-antigen/teichoic acid export membrane protein